MTKSDRRQCKVATSSIEACVKGQRNVRDTLEDLNEAICLLSDHERALSLVLRRKWAVLQEIQFYATYRSAAPISLEHCAQIESTMNEMKTILVQRLSRNCRNESSPENANMSRLRGDLHPVRSPDSVG